MPAEPGIAGMVGGDDAEPMWIYLLRHGLAEDPRPGQMDEDRALTDEGKQRLRRAATAWNKLMPAPDVVLTSPLRRARETTAVFAKAVDYGGELRVEQALVPNASPSLAVQLLEGELLARTEGVAIVGHEPHLGYLLGELLTAHPRVSVPLKKGMLVGLEAVSSTSLVTGLRFTLTQKAAARLA